MSKKEQWMFLYKAGMLLDAGLVIEETFAIAGRGVKDKRLKNDIETMAKDLASGKSLKEAFDVQRQRWGRVTISLAEVGELSGTLSLNLQRASENMRQIADQRVKIISSLFYPAIISVLAFGIIIFLISFVYPKIIPLFMGMKVELPLSTRFLIGLSGMIQIYWVHTLVGTSLIGFLLFYLVVEFVRVRLFFERVILRMPIIGKIVALNQFCEVAFVTGSLCQGGMALSDALHGSHMPVYFLSLKKHFEDIHNNLSSGVSFSDCIMKQHIFPHIWVDLIIVGEKTGGLSSMLLRISEIHRQEIDELMTMLNKMIEPLMMIGVGLIVGFIAMSIVGPMYSLTQHV